MARKKIARPINKAKNEFVKWLENNNATNIDVYEGNVPHEWDYYRMVSAFINDDFCIVYFMMLNGEVKIDYKDEENRYDDLNVNEFLELLN